MFIRTFIIAALVVTGFAASNAQAEGFISIGHEQEVEVSVISGSVWVPGYWQGRGHHHVWVDGYWQQPVYRQQHYTQQPYLQQEYREQYYGDRGYRRDHHSRKCG